MKLLRYGPGGQEKPGVLDDDGRIRDLSDVVEDIANDTLTDEGLAKIRAAPPASLPVVPDSPRLGACVGGVGKFVCIGLNYSDHAAESGMPLPSEPILFMKATSAISGPNDTVVLPRGSNKTDWEVELGVVIGEGGKNIPEKDAINHIAGYCVVNDLSERKFQLEQEGQWVKGKSCDTYGPIGPWLVTRDEVPDPQALDIWLEVNGNRYQDGNTRTMVFKAGMLVSYISGFMSLQPGDIVSTGTPPGVGLGMSPPQYLKPGDQITLGVQGLGIQRQDVVEAEDDNPRLL